MRLTQAMGGWALVDAERQRLAAIAGGLNAWAPRIVNGEGLHALPIIGRFQPLDAFDAIDQDLGLGRMFWSFADGGATGLAAVMGVSVQYRADPVRCILGFIHVAHLPGPGPLRLGSVLVSPSALAVAGQGCGNEDIAKQLDLRRVLARFDAKHALRTGDVIVLDSAKLSFAQQRLLLADDLKDGVGAGPPLATADHAMCA